MRDYSTNEVKEYGVGVELMFGVEAQSESEAHQKAAKQLIEFVEDNDNEAILKDADHLMQVVDVA